MRVINATPHAIILQSKSGWVEFPATGKVARLTTSQKTIDMGLPYETVEEGYEDVVDLPEPSDNTIILVSRVVAAALPDRTDLCYPTNFVRDESGRIVGARALARPAR